MFRYPATGYRLPATGYRLPAVGCRQPRRTTSSTSLPGRISGSVSLPVRRPRHFVIYRFESGLVEVGRLLHDAMELARHLGPDSS